MDYVDIIVSVDCLTLRLLFCGGDDEACRIMHHALVECHDAESAPPHVAAS
jgi:hypothetical protein